MLTFPLQDPQVLETRGSALVTNKHSSGRNTTTFDKQVCDYCNKPYHTRETCWDLHNIPADWKPRKLHKNPKSAHLAESKSGLENLLRQFLHQTKLQNSADGQNSKSPTAAMAQTGTISQTLLSMSQQPNCWIVDTGASDHMTGSMEVFDDYTNCHNKINVWVADGKTSPAVGQGMVRLPNMILKSVLFVPKLTYNLLSVSKLTHDMDCVVIFFSSHCEFQDRSSGKMIGIAEKKDGLYSLSRIENSSSNKSHNTRSLSVSNSDILLWHQRLDIQTSLICRGCIPIFSSIKKLIYFSVSIVCLQNNPEVIIRLMHINPLNFFTLFTVTSRVRLEHLI